MTAKIHSQGMMNIRTPEQIEAQREKDVFDFCAYELFSSELPLSILSEESFDILKTKFPELYKTLLGIEKAIKKMQAIVAKIEEEKGW